MAKCSEISLEQFRWLLSHYNELHIRNPSDDITIKAKYVYRNNEIVPGIVITESTPISYQLVVNNVEKEFSDKDSILEHLIDNDLISDRIEILDFKECYGNNTIDCGSDDFNDKLNTYIDIVNFEETDMIGLLDIYGPISTHFTIYTSVSDPNDCNNLFKEYFPEEYEIICVKYKLFVECMSSNNLEPFYRYLGLDDISDLIIDTYPHWRGVLTFNEWTLTISVTPRSLDWLRKFPNDYSMGVFNDLCFYKDQEQLYESITHEHQRSDMAGIIKRFKNR